MPDKKAAGPGKKAAGPGRQAQGADAKAAGANAKIKPDLARQLALFLYLRERREGATTDEILGALPYECDGSGASDSAKKKLSRDCDALAALGFYIDSPSETGDGRYRIDGRRTYAAPLSFAGVEAAFLRIVCLSFLQDDSYTRKMELLGALARMSDELELPDTLVPLMDDEPSKSPVLSGDSKMAKALREGGALSFVYEVADKVKTQRTAVPLRSFSFNRRLYIVALDSAACQSLCAVTGEGKDPEPAVTGEGEACAPDGLRVFRLDRMSNVKAAGSAKFDGLPPVDPARLDRWPCLPFQFSMRRFAAKVRLAPGVAATASAVTWGSGELHAQDDGGSLWEVEASDPDALAAWCIENGPGLRPLEPLAVREAFDRKLEAARRACDVEAAKEACHVA